MEMTWSKLPLIERACALHEGSHAVVSELLFWTVESVSLNSGGQAGMCCLRGAAPRPWIDIIVSLAGHAAERHFCGRVIDAPSEPDRRAAEKKLRTAGLEDWSAPWVARELESEMWPLFTNGSIKTAVFEVASELVRLRALNRPRFLSAARPALRSATLARMVRRFCERLTMKALAAHIEEAS